MEQPPSIDRWRVQSPRHRVDLRGFIYAPDSPMAEVLDEIDSLARSGAPVILWGESGSGRRTMARLLHERSDHRNQALRRLKAHPTTTERDLRTALSTSPRISLLIEEAPRLSSSLQDQLADFLDSDAADGVRVVATCKGEPSDLVASGGLREDLFYRLGVFSIRIPPLRERPTDTRRLAAHLIDLANHRHGISVEGVSDEALDHLVAADWPGNVPDLRRAIDHAAISVGTGTIRLSHLPTGYLEAVRKPRPLVLPPGTPMAEAERRLILATLEQTGQNKAEAARRLGLDVKTVRNKLRSYGLM